MPQAIPFIAQMIIMYAISQAMKPRRSHEAAVTGSLLNTASTTDPLPVIYGTRRVGGNRVFIEVTDGFNFTQQDLHLIYVLCEGEISAINQVYIDARETVASFPGVTVHKFTGTDDQAASTDLIAEFGEVSPYAPGKWTNEHRGRGVAYCYIKIEWNETDYPVGMPSQFLFDVDGKRVWDLRDSPSDPSVLTFSDNPALCILDYLMNERYGCGVPLAMIDQATFIVAANYYDELVTAYGAGSPSVTQKRYTCNGILWPDQGYFENLSALLSSCRSMLVFSAGQWRLRAEKIEAPSNFTFNEDNIVGAWAIKKAGKRERFNRVRARWFNPGREWTEDLAIYESAAHQAEDNGMILENDIPLPFTTNVYTALQLAQIEEKTSRQGVQAEFTATIAGMRCEVGDVVLITHATPGWDAKPFRVMNIGMLSSDEVRITAREYNDSSYVLDPLAQVDDPPDTNLPDPFADLTVTLGAPTSGTPELFLGGDGTVFSRIRVPLTATVNAVVAYYDVQFARTSSPTEWQDAPDVLSPASNVYAYPVEDGVTYDLRVRAVTVLGNSGAWAYVYGHLVVGKTAAPSNVTGFTVSFDGASTLFRWEKVSDIDVAEYEVRLGSTWAASSLVGRTRADFLRIEALAAAATYLIKAFDTSGNESAAAASVTVTPVAPNQVVPSAAFDGADVKLTWAAVSGGSYPVARYEVRHGTTWAGGTSAGFVDVTTFRVLGNWSGSRTWWVAGIDAAGTVGTPGSVEVVVTVPFAPTITPEVIDNNVLLRWTDATQTLPLKHYEIRRGTTFAGATVIGTVQARFSMIFESSAGLYLYWVVGVDSAGNYGTEQSTAVTVSAPPDFIFYDQTESVFAGTKTNCYIMPENGKLLACVNVTETLAQHFEFANGGSPSWATIQDQINAGFPIYIEPSRTSGQYVEELDYGTTIPSTLITVSLASTVIAGSVTVTPTISTREDGSPNPWTDHAGVWQVYATNFRYVKITLDLSSSGGNDLLLIDSLSIRLDVKIKRDSETVTCNSGDSGGTTVTFAESFIDVRSITTTAQGTTPAVCVVDFTDAPNPTDFKVLVFDLAGVRITRDVRWEASGV